MATGVSVVIPWSRFSGADRKRALAFVADFYASEFPSWTRLVGGEPSRPFSRARAINNAAALVSGEILVCNDADSLIPPDSLRQAVAVATTLGGQVKAYTRYRRVSKEAMAGATSYRDVLALPDEAFYWEMPFGHCHGVMVMRRADFLATGGYDPRFQGWGYEDLAFDVVAQTMWEPHRVDVDLRHMWHEPDPTAHPEDEWCQRNSELFNRYDRAKGDQEALLMIRAEADADD